jgi:hypothetical protein
LDGSGQRVGVGTGVNVGGREVYVGSIGEGMYVGGIGIEGVEAGAHPFNKTIRKTNARNNGWIEFFMTLSLLLILLRKLAAELFINPPFGGLTAYGRSTCGLTS